MKATNFSNCYSRVFLCALSVFALTVGGCASAPIVSGTLGYSQDRRVVIVGENVAQDIAVYYQRRYDAMVWFTPPEGMLKHSTQAILKGIGPSTAMRSLINELQSINQTMGRWEIIIPGIAEKYFLVTLKEMQDGALSHARGNFVLIDSQGNKDVETQVARVTNNSFFVTYEFQKY